MKKTLAQKLSERKIKKPPALIYLVLGYIWKLLFFKKHNVRVEKRINPRKIKGPFLVVSNHVSRNDYLYAAIPFLPKRLNFVAGYNEFFRSHLAGIFKLLQEIPKRNFVPDIRTIVEVKRVLDKGGSVIIFPEGMNSISGRNQPVAIGSGKLIKRLNVPVYSVKISGGYLTNTKYCLDTRPGRVDVIIDQMFTREQLGGLSDEDIHNALNEFVKHDDYEWNKKERVAYDGHGEMCKNMHHYAYYCPRCASEFKTLGEGNVIKCTECGNGARHNEFYDLVPLDESCVIPETPAKWFDLQRQKARELISRPDFEMREPVKLGTLPDYKLLKDLKTSVITGEGEMYLNPKGFGYKGTRNGEPFEFFLPSAQIPTFGMCTDMSICYTFYNGEFFEFNPARPVIAKWLLCVEELHRFNGGKWKAE